MPGASLRGFFATLCLLTIGLANAVHSGPLSVRLATATPGGGFELFGRHLAEAVGKAASGVAITTVATRGSRQNLALLERGEVDIGLVEGNAARQALDGIERAPSGLKVLGVMYPNPGMFVVRADSPFHTMADLEGQPLTLGTRASGLRILAHDVLDGLGLSPERDFRDTVLDKAGDGPRLVLDGSVAALWGAGIGWPGFVRVADSDAGARFIAPTAEQRARILAAHPHLRPMTVPARTYRGQDAPIDSVGLWSLILVRPDLPTETVYRLAAALHAAERPLSDALAQGRFSTAANTAREVPAERLHPGAAQFLREQGLLGD